MVHLTTTISKILIKLFPGLSIKLVKAGIYEKPEDFIKKSLLVTAFMVPFVMLLITLVVSKLQLAKWILLLTTPIIFAMFFSTFMKRPDVLIMKQQREFDKEIVFAGRFFVVELKSGVPVYNAMLSVSKSYPTVSKHFMEILNRVNIGTPMEDAINEGIESSPSQNFVKFLWQILNSMKTGSDLAAGLTATLDQIAAEQVIAAKEYGKKLNPIVMFYMVTTVIFPSIGVVMLIVFSNFFSIKITLPLLLSIALATAFMQLIFLTIVKHQRPVSL